MGHLQVEDRFEGLILQVGFPQSGHEKSEFKSGMAKDNNIVKIDPKACDVRAAYWWRKQRLK